MILASLYVNPAMWTDDAPADLKAKVGPMTPETKRQRVLLSIPFFATLVAVLVLSIFQLRVVMGGELTFPAVFVHTFIVLMTFNLVDLVIIDWLIMAMIQPKFVIVPGTEGMAGYRDYAFHFRAFLKGTVGMLVISLISAGVTIWVMQ
jgi:hypothetical protein